MPYNPATGFAWLLSTDFVIKTTVYTTPAHTACVDASLYDGLTFNMRTGAPTGAVVITKALAAGITITGTFNSDPAINTQLVNIAIAAADQSGLAPGPYFWTLERSDSAGSIALFAGTAVANAAP